jgi:hypothetical protein
MQIGINSVSPLLCVAASLEGRNVSLPQSTSQANPQAFVLRLLQVQVISCNYDDKIYIPDLNISRSLYHKVYWFSRIRFLALEFLDNRGYEVHFCITGDKNGNSIHFRVVYLTNDLQYVNSDLLVLLDCCISAGSLGGVGDKTASIGGTAELMAACRYKAKPSGLGTQYFPEALIVTVNTLKMSVEIS